MSDADILASMSASSSSKRYQAHAQPATATASQPVPVRRASLKTGAQPVPVLERPRRGGTSEPITRANGPKPRPLQAQATAQLDLDNEQSAQATVQLEYDAEYNAEMPAQTTLLGDDTNAHTDIQVRLPVPYRRPQAHGKHQYKHALVFVGLGMIAMLLIWMVGVQAMVGWTNTVSDPRYYTQTAHLDVVMVKIDAHNESQVRAFLDPQGHLDLFVFPVGGDVSKAHVVVGPTPTTVTDLRHTTIIVTVHDTIVTVTIQGPLEANYLSTMRQSSAWSIDLKKTGGH